MSVIIVLIGASLLVAAGFLIAYLWAVKSGQYDDKYTPSVRILFEEEKKSEIGSKKSEIRNEKT
ncbi:MAG: cbb3-type cytochrome oxidase assembly protein CcoS [Melioribacteraceae bacterium]